MHEKIKCKIHLEINLWQIIIYTQIIDQINIKVRLWNVDNVFIFIMQCQQVYDTYTLFFRKDRSRVNWLSIVKTKLRSHVQVVQDSNDELITGDDIFQLDGLVNPYRAALSNDLEENLNFHAVENILVDVDVEELNDVLRTNEHT